MIRKKHEKRNIFKTGPREEPESNTLTPFTPSSSGSPSPSSSSPNFPPLLQIEKPVTATTNTNLAVSFFVEDHKLLSATHDVSHPSADTNP